MPGDVRPLCPGGYLTFDPLAERDHAPLSHIATRNATSCVAIFDSKARQDVDNGDMVVQVYKYRKLAKLTQQALGEAAGISRSYISEIERGKKSPNTRRLEQLAGALGVLSADLLLEDEEDPDLRQFIRAFLALDPSRQERAFRYIASLMQDSPEASDL